MAYFLSSSTLMKKEVVPEYSISARRSRAAAECTTGMDTLLMMLLTITASRRVQVPLWHRGSSSPCAAEPQEWLFMQASAQSALTLESIPNPTTFEEFLRVTFEEFLRVTFTVGSELCHGL